MLKFLSLIILIILISSCGINIGDKGVKVDDGKGNKIEIGDKGIDLNTNVDIDTEKLTQDLMNMGMDAVKKELDNEIIESSNTITNNLSTKPLEEQSETEQINTLNALINNKSAFAGLSLIDQKMIISLKNSLEYLVKDDSKNYLKEYKKSNNYSILSFKQKQKQAFESRRMEKEDFDYSEFSDLMDKFFKEQRRLNSIIDSDKINDENIVLLNSFINGQDGGTDLSTLILTDQYVQKFNKMNHIKFFEGQILEVKNDMDKLEEFINKDL